MPPSLLTYTLTYTQATGYLGSGDEDSTSLTGVGGNLVQLTPETIKDLGSEQIYKVCRGGGGPLLFYTLWTPRTRHSWSTP